MSDIPYKLYKVADITQVANSEKVAGAIFFDDATETTHIYGADGTPVIYGSRKWTWSGINYTTFVEEVSVGDSVLWSANELTIVARKNTTAANIVVVTLISDSGFNTLKFIKSSSTNTWSLSSSVVEDFDDFVKTSDVVSTASTINTVVGRDGAGDIWVRNLVDSNGNIVAFPNGTEASIAGSDYTLQEEIADLDTIRNNAKTAAESIPDLEGDIEQLQGVTADIATIRSNAAKGASAVQKSGDTMTGTLTVPTVMGDLKGTSDFAKDLTGRIEATPEEFNFRPSAGDKSIRDESAVIRSIKGNSVVLNQHFKGVNTRTLYGYKTSSEGNIVTIENVSASTPSYGNMADIIDFSITAGHKYLALADTPFRITINGIVGWYFELNEITISAPDLDYGETWVRMPSAPPLDILPVGGSVSFTLVIHDLTQMFGAGNEPTTIEEFYERLPQGVDINAYNEGEIIDGNYEAIETVGFNQWDEQWDIGYINSEGVDGPSTGAIRSINYINVLPNTQYCSNINNYSYLGGKGISLRYYNASKKIIGTGAMFANWTTSQNTITTPKDCFFIRFYAAIPPEEYNNDICINLSHTGVRNGEYEPYEKHIKDLSVIQKYFPNGMRSAGSIYDEIRYNEATEQWEAVQRIGVVDLGELTWGYLSSILSFYTTIATIASPTTNMLSDRFVNYPSGVTSSAQGDKIMSCHAGGICRFRDTSYGEDVTAFSAAMQGVMLNYELAEPIITPIVEPIQLDYWVEDFGTERLKSTGGSTPFKADIIYQFNATDRIRDNYRNIALLSKSKMDNPNGTASQFVKGDGSLDSSSYAKVQTVSLLTASGSSITKDVYNAMVVADVVKFIYNNGQYELIMSAKQKVNSSIAYSTMFFDAKENVFKSFSVVFNAPSSSANTVGYTVTLANLAIGAATVSEEV